MQIETMGRPVRPFRQEKPLVIRRPGFLREMRGTELSQVDRLLQNAFGRREEADLVKKLRSDRVLAGEQVLPFEDGIAGYAALSEMRSPEGWLCLAPVAIAPDFQGFGHGRRMVGILAEWARRSGVFLVVLGEPEFYRRCGFSSERAAGLSAPYPASHLLLAGPGEDAPKETLKYPHAFG
ncbi:GNAT family N-acetyltransferase [Primorskyibacter flagellatus]|uniref:GNAT family N-acetyltransferase n=1 Tax=Primorskyibacter flagellatus TaxID=1387277 RepID=UPI003A92742D